MDAWPPVCKQGVRGSSPIPLGARAPSGYTDTAALNDIHALLTTAEPGGGALGDIALILCRTGRPMVRVRDIEVSSVETALGWPVACVDAGDTTAYVRQAPSGTGLLIEITTQTDAEHDAITVIVGFCLYLAAAFVTIRQLIQRARTRYRWDTRPTTKRLK